MSDSAIEWTDKVWNPTTGCDQVSAGCDNCYALTMAKRLNGMGQPKYQTDGDPRTSGPGFGLAMHEDALDLPLRWRKPRRIFVNSMSDLFHPKVTDAFIAKVFAVMAATPQHTYQVLTKRAPRMLSLVGYDGVRLLEAAADEATAAALYEQWPLPNVWLGVSVENQEQADARIPRLVDTPAAVRWLSCEPLLGPIDLSRWLVAHGEPDRQGGIPIDWAVIGGESGSGARPMHPAWARHLRNQCTAVAVPFFFKQWGEYAYATVENDPTFAGGRAYANPHGGRSAAVVRSPGSTGTMRTAITRPLRPGDETRGGAVMLDQDTIAIRAGKKIAGRTLDGRTWDEYPTVAVGA